MGYSKIRPRRGTPSQWSTANTVLAEGEIAIETPAGGTGTGPVNIKFGDGSTAWNNLPYALGKKTIVDMIYPVGSIYISANSVNPATLFGGTWTQIKDKFLLASGSHPLGSTGGEETHTLTVSEMPSHSHDEILFSNGYRATIDAKNDGSVSGYRMSFTGSDTIASGAKLETNNTGGGSAHNNMPPYLAVSVWKRTA